MSTFDLHIYVYTHAITHTYAHANIQSDNCIHHMTNIQHTTHIKHRNKIIHFKNFVKPGLNARQIHEHDRFTMCNVNMNVIRFQDTDQKKQKTLDICPLGCFC